MFNGGEVSERKLMDGREKEKNSTGGGGDSLYTHAWPVGVTESFDILRKETVDAEVTID